MIEQRLRMLFSLAVFLSFFHDILKLFSNISATVPKFS